MSSNENDHAAQAEEEDATELQFPKGNSNI